MCICVWIKILDGPIRYRDRVQLEPEATCLPVLLESTGAESKLVSLLSFNFVRSHFKFFQISTPEHHLIITYVFTNNCEETHS